MGIGIADGDNRAKKSVDSALSSPLLEETNITGAKHILVNITSGTKEVTMDEIFAITEFVQEEAGDGANLIWGNCYDETLGDKLSVTVIATGFESRTQNNHKEADTKVVLTLDDEPIRKDAKRHDFFGFGFDDTEGGNSLELDSSRFSKPRPTYNQPHEPFVKNDNPVSDDERRRRLAVETQRREKLRTNVNSMKLNNPQTIIEMENEPAYMRRGVRLDSVQHSSEKPVSQWSIDENNELNTSGNSFLHDNVD